MRPPAPKTWLLVALLSLWTAGLVQVVAVLSRDSPARGSTRAILLVGLVYGAISAVVSLSVWWLTLVGSGRPGRELSRHGLITGLIVWLGLSWQMAPTLADPIDERTVADTLAIAWGYQWIAIAAVLWIARHYGGWHAGDTQLPHRTGPDDTGSRQFSIRSLLIATAVIAIVLAIGRETVPDDVDRVQARTWSIVRTLLFCVAGGVCQAAVGLAAIWLLATGASSWRIPLSFVTLAAACTLQTFCYSLAAGPIKVGAVATTVAATGGAHFLVLTVGLLTLHATGYRLRRHAES